MKHITIVSVLFAALLSSGCAQRAVQHQAPPNQTYKEAIPYTLRTDVKSEDEIFVNASRLSTTAPIYYHQTSGGGGAAVGLAFGALGVLANTALIQNATKNDVKALSQKIAVDPVNIAKANLSQNPAFTEATESSQGLLISPYLMVVKDEHDRLLMTTSIEVESGTWKGRYSYHLEYRKSLSAYTNTLSEADAQELQANVEEGFRQSISMLEDDLAGKMQPTRNVTFYTSAVSPAFKGQFAARLIPSEGELVTVLGPGNADQFKYSLSSGYHRINRYRAEIGNRQ